MKISVIGKNGLPTNIPIKNYGLDEFQKLNAAIYLVQKDCNYNTADMVSRMHRYITQVLKAVRKGKTENVGFWLSMSFSWSLALANRLHIKLDSEMWKRFPGVCPYCNQPVCGCKERAVDRSVLVANPEHTVYPNTLRCYQEMFARIYPHNTLQDVAMHLAEEAGEVDEAIEHYMGSHQKELFDAIIIELVDVVANISAVANCLKLDLAIEMEKNFLDGCIRCHTMPCNCGFTIANSVSV